jgi:hypothetical protein
MMAITPLSRLDDSRVCKFDLMDGRLNPAIVRDIRSMNATYGVSRP